MRPLFLAGHWHNLRGVALRCVASCLTDVGEPDVSLDLHQLPERELNRRFQSGRVIFATLAKACTHPTKVQMCSEVVAPGTYKKVTNETGFGVFSSPALADPNPTLGGRWGYDRGDYYGRSYNEAREYKQEFYRGPCKIERKRERNGEYKEETKCKGYR
jgi:hypothetical protein